MKNNIKISTVSLCLIGVVAYWLIVIILLSLVTVFTQNEYLSEGNWQIASLIMQLIASVISVGIVIRMYTDNGVLTIICTGLGCVITHIVLSITFFNGITLTSVWNIVAIALGGFIAFVASNKRKNNVKSRKKRIRNR